ncbi:hypothetical protein OY671_011921, partial [Metschnikowia pulcherrima]
DDGAGGLRAGLPAAPGGHQPVADPSGDRRRRSDLGRQRGQAPGLLPPLRASDPAAGRDDHRLGRGVVRAAGSARFPRTQGHRGSVPQTPA